MKVLVIFSFVFWLFVPALFADTLYLKNGDVLTGNLITFQEGATSFSSIYGSQNLFPVSDIRALATDEMYVIEFFNGEKMKGKLSVDKKTRTVVESENAGEVNISIVKVQSMVRDYSPSVNNELSDEVNSEDAEKATTQQEYGEKNEEEAPLDFLTGSTVLLAPGEYEFEVDFAYKNSRNSYALTQAGYFERSAYSARSLQMGLSLRGGLAEGIEGWVRVPFTYSRVEDVSTNAYVRDEEQYRLGDVAFGLQYLLARETADRPAVSLSLSASAPTGQKRYRFINDIWLDPLDNGSGHWTVSPGISFVKTTDPAILYGGLSYAYSFANEIDGYDVQPGWAASGYMGVGFALNESLSLGARVSYGYAADMEADGVRVRGTSYEPMDLSFVGSYRFAEGWVVSPQVTFGLNDDSGASNLGMRFTRSIK